MFCPSGHQIWAQYGNRVFQSSFGEYFFKICGIIWCYRGHWMVLRLASFKQYGGMVKLLARPRPGYGLLPSEKVIKSYYGVMDEKMAKHPAPEAARMIHVCGAASSSGPVPKVRAGSAWKIMRDGLLGIRLVRIPLHGGYANLKKFGC